MLINPKYKKKKEQTQKKFYVKEERKKKKGKPSIFLVSRVCKRKKFLRFLLRKFVNNMMVKGKEEKSEKILLSSFSTLYAKEKKNPLYVFYQSLKNSKPYVEVCSVRKGGASYQIPIPCRESRGISLSMKWILEVARKRKAYSFKESLSSAFLESANSLSDSVKKRDLLHGTALKNRSLTHYRWF